METDLQKVLKQKVPYIAHVYPKYKPLLENNPDEDLIADYMEEFKMEMDDDNTDGRSLAKIKRAHNIAGTEEHEDCELDVYCHVSLCCYMDTVEERIRRNGWGIKNFKIFHIWNIKVNEKSGILPWSAKFQPLTNKIEVEIHSEKKNENDTSKVKVVDFIIDTEDCDKSLIVTVDDCELNYSVFSDALRVELEFRFYDVDGSPALNFSGDIHAYFVFGKAERCITLFDGEHKNEESEVVIRSSLILPRRIWPFVITTSLEDNIGKFMSIQRPMMIPRSVPIDEQHYILGQRGYILLTAKWGCCCVDKGLCVCPGSAACGIETFQDNYPSAAETSEEEEEDSESSLGENRKKKKRAESEEEEDSESSLDENRKKKRAKMAEDPPVFGTL